MATVPQNSPRSRQSRRSMAARGVPAENSPPFSLSGIVDQEQFLISSSTTTSSHSPSTKEASTTVAASSSSLAEDGADAQLDNSENGGAAKKPVWNKPSNETAAADVVGVVMGADSWPALSESARASPKSSSAHSLKSLSIGSITVSQELVVGSSASPKEVVNTSVSTPNLSSNHLVVPVRQKSMKRGGGSSSQGNIPGIDGVSSQQPPVQGDSKVIQVDSKVNRGGSSSFRRNNGGSQPRDGSYHHRRDQDRGKQDWSNAHRGFGRESSHAPQQFSTPRVGSRSFVRGPALNAPHVPPPPPPVRSFMPPMVYTDMPSPPMYYIPGPYLDSFRPMSMVPPIPQVPQMHVNMPDPQLPSRILNQIDYYFSNENLVKDTFLRRNMDNEGWVSVNLIAGFKKVMQLTDNIQLILETVQSSNVVEVQGDQLRRRGDWIKWIMPSVQTSITSPGSNSMSSQNMLAMHLNSVTLDEKAAT